MMDDAELVRRLRDGWLPFDIERQAADRIEALIAERDAARDAALEEAAKVADECFKQNSFGRRDLYKWGIASGAQAIAAAIRALKGKSHE